MPRPFACSTQATEESRYWLGLPWNQVRAFPRDVSSGKNRYGESQSIRAELSLAETNALQRTLPRISGASVGEILLAVCIQTLSAWAKCETVLVDLTDHGRHELFNNISLARTVGYIT